MIDKKDAHNLLTIMNKCEYKGLDEALVATVLRNKLEQIVNPTPIPEEETPEE